MDLNGNILTFGSDLTIIIDSTGSNDTISNANKDNDDNSYIANHNV